MPFGVSQKEFDAIVAKDQALLEYARKIEDDTVALYRAQAAERRSKKAEIEARLLARGVALDIGACGCCNSPWIKIALDGEVVYEADGEHFDMVPE